MSPNSPQNPPDQELIDQYLHGDSGAFETLFQRYKNGIYLLIRQFFPQPERTEEIFQEVFMKVLERLDRFRATGSFRGWLYTLCRNHCIDRIRYRNRHPETPMSASFSGEGEDNPLERIPSDEKDGEATAYRKELAQQLAKALEKLPKEQLETFLLKERGEMTFEEIAKVSGVSINTVKSRMRYALEHLRRALKNKPFVKEALNDR